jgi:hypothetical protein
MIRMTSSRHIQTTVKSLPSNWAIDFHLSSPSRGVG